MHAECTSKPYEFEGLGSAPEVHLQHIYRGIVPFVLLQLAAPTVVIAYPQAALWLMHVANG